MGQNIVYLDNNATTAPAPEAVAAMLPYLSEWFGNPSSLHHFGARLRPVLDLAREQVCALIGALPSEIVFTSGGTESDNWAVFMTLAARLGRNHFITTAVEHVAVLDAARRLEKEGVEVTRLKVDREGRLDLDELSAALKPTTALVSVMHANNETGVIFPIAEVSARVKKSGSGAWMHVDAVQSFGKVPIDLHGWGVDLLSASGHKIHGPKGVGLLAVRKGLHLPAMQVGGHQERDRRAGTENVPGIVGMGAAAELMAKGKDTDPARVQNLRDRLEKGLRERIPEVTVNGDNQPRIYNTSSVNFRGVEAEPVLVMLSEAGIAASSGSACTSGSLEPSHVLQAMGVPLDQSHGAIRFSLSRYNTEADIERVLAVMPGIIERLRRLNKSVVRHG